VQHRKEGAGIEAGVTHPGFAAHLLSSSHRLHIACWVPGVDPSPLGSFFAGKWGCGEDSPLGDLVRVKGEGAQRAFSTQPHRCSMQKYLAHSTAGTLLV
jgi:hypothetical protein